MNIQEINRAIITGNFTNDQLTSIVSAVTYARSQLRQEIKRSIRLGDTVKFTSNRNGVTYTGTVNKVKLKYVLVRTNAGLYNVPANMLEAI